MKSKKMHSVNKSVFERFPELESNRLRYKEYEKGHAGSLLYIRNHPMVSKYMDSALLKNIEESEMRIANILQDFKEQKGITWAIIDKKTDKLIGDFGIWKIDFPNSRGELGYVLNPEYWGRGYMKETMDTLITFAFNKMNLHSLEADVNPENENSKKLLLKYKFKMEAYFRENYYFDGQFLDSEIYTLLKTDL